MNFNTFILENEIPLHISFFFGVFAIMASWEVIKHKRVLLLPKMQRWLNNLGIVFFNSILLRLLFPTAAVGVAAFASEHGWGLLNYYSLPFMLSVILSIVIMDFIIYLQHIMVHAVPLLWRLHRVHHADLDYDVTTGARFHPLEIILSMLIKFTTIIVLGPLIIAVILFEIILNALAMFNHSNVGLPKPLEKYIRWFIVNPDMHRVHHSVEDDETNSNFGFNLICWDRLLGTYRKHPIDDQLCMTIGIHHHKDPKQCNQFLGMLLLPFQDKISEYAINTRRWDPKQKIITKGEKE